MLSIMASTKYADSEQGSKQGLMCFSALGGQKLGQLVVSQSADMYGTLRDLQVQASKLMPTTTRSFEDIVLRCLGADITPIGFAYKQHMTQDEIRQASIIFSATKVDVFWDNDEFVRCIMHENNMSFQRDEQVNKLIITCTGDGVFTSEVAGFLRNSRVDRCQFSSFIVAYNTYCVLTDRTENITVPNVKMLSLSRVSLDTLRAFRDIVHLTIIYAGMPSSIGQLDKLRVLNLAAVLGNVPADFGDLRLDELSICGTHRLDVLQFAPHFTRLATLTKLKLCNNTWFDMPPRCCPSEIGHLASLKSLIVENNKFTGCIPTELSRLTNLSTLVLTWFEEDGHLEVPQQVRDLQVANKTIVQY